MPRRAKPGVNWIEIEKQVRAGQSLTSVAKQHGIARQTLTKRADKQGWRDGPQKWMPAVMTTLTTKRLESPENGSDKQLATRGDWSPELQAAILYSLSEGVSMAQAAEMHGVSYDSFLKRRKQDPIFDRLVWQARHEMLGSMQGEITKSARRGDWKAAQAVLSAAPETRSDWGQKASGGPGITVNISLRQDNAPNTVDITPVEGTQPDMTIEVSARST